MVGLLGLVFSKTLDHVIHHLAITIQVIDCHLNDEVLMLGHNVGYDSSRAIGHGTIDAVGFLEPLDLDFTTIQVIHIIAQRLALQILVE